jgi:hypothetical protein
MVPQSFDLYTLLHNFKDGKEERLGEKELNGRKVLGFKITRAVPDELRGKNAQMALSLWVDPGTNLPVEGEGTINGEAFRFSGLKWDQEMKDADFAMTVPDGWKLQDMGGIKLADLKSPPTTQEASSLILKPGIGIGELKFGDSKDRVIALLGTPEKEQQVGDIVELSYPSKGLGVGVVQSRGLPGVTSIGAMTKKSAGPFAMNDFPGKTDKGIAMGATAEQVLAAYGAPSSQIAQEKAPIPQSPSVMSYDKLGLIFTLRDGQVVAINLFRVRNPPGTLP